MSSGRDARIRLTPGDSFRAKWSGAEITVERTLGEGANGSVYLVHSSIGPSRCALKVGVDAYSLQSEINALRSIAGALPARSEHTVPELIMADDGRIRGESFSFYMMSYVPGTVLSEITLPGVAVIRAGTYIMAQLAAMHRVGWAFGDMKTDNIMVLPDGRARLIDYGGSVPFGRSVSQFTELYDRGYWKAGSRKADAAYDLFSFAVVLIEAAGSGKRLRLAATESGRNRRMLYSLLSDTPVLSPVAPIIRKMFRAEYGSADEAMQDWLQAAGRIRTPSAKTSRWVAVWFTAALVSFIVVVWRNWPA